MRFVLVALLFAISCAQTAEFTADSVTPEGVDVVFTPIPSSNTGGGMYYYVMVPASDPAPTADDIKNGAGGSVCSGSFPITGLSINTHTVACAQGPADFNVYVAHDASGDGTVELASPSQGTLVKIPDLDECASASANDCDTNAACTNTDGSFTCACNTGWEGDGKTCSDVDECSGTNDCSSNAACTNTDGSYTCACNVGYSGDGFSCSDINECSSSDLNTCDANASCTNTLGTNTCACNTGYEGDGDTCTDVDECSATNDCSSNASCTNNIGSYTCACNTGYTGDGKTCTDLIECAGTTTNDCSANAMCTNTVGSYTCECSSGYTGDGYTCSDVNDCDADNDCAAMAICTNTPGSYTCACDTGYTGDGFSCAETTTTTSTTTTQVSSTTATTTGTTTTGTTTTGTTTTGTTTTGTTTATTTGTTTTGTTTGTVTSTTTGTSISTTGTVTTGTTTGITYYAECEVMTMSQCSSAQYCFWDGSECEGSEREVGEGMLTVCSGYTSSATCQQIVICTWTGVSCQPNSVSMEYETELTCENMPQASCAAPCQWSFTEYECIEAEAELERESYYNTGCLGKVDANACYSAGNCVWISARCFAVGENIVLKKEQTKSNETSATPNYLLVAALAFVSSFIGVVMAMRCRKEKEAQLDDVLLENRFSIMA